MDFTAIDFETANGSRASACSVGLVRVRFGRVVESQSWLIKPAPEVGEFHERNVAIHGITSDMVADAPGWGEVLPQMVEFVGRDFLLAHNASFERSVIVQSSESVGVRPPEFPVVCTVELGKRGWPDMPSHRLPDMCERFGVSLDAHHDALADARAVAEFVPHMMVLTGTPSVAALTRKLGVRVHRTAG